MAVHVLDDYYLAITLLITIAYQLWFFMFAWIFKFDKLTDFAGGTNFVVLSIITLAWSGQPTTRQIVASVFMMVWGARLSGFLLFRILKTGKDDRFDDKRDKFLPFLGFWVAQMLWVWVVSLPITITNSPNIQQFVQPAYGTGSDITGILLWTIGFVMESVSDFQKYRFRSNPANKGKVCDVGLFRSSRHPNYFGEIIMQFGIYLEIIAPSAHKYVTGAPAGAQFASVVGPVFLTVLLLFVSGINLQERPAAKKRYESGNHYDHYKAYTQETSILWPLPRRFYRAMPKFIKRTILLEFPMYVFDPAKHADQKKRDNLEQEEGQATAHE